MGVLMFIHSDRGTQFEFELFKQLCTYLGITKSKTTAYRPQSDGMRERINRTIEEILSKYVAENQRDWVSICLWSSQHIGHLLMIVLVFLLPFYSLAANQDFQNLLMGDPPPPHKMKIICPQTIRST